MVEEQQETALKNTVTIESAGPCKKKVIVEIPRETIQKATDEHYETFRKEVILPGFRKGRAPRRLLEKRFGKEATEQVKLKLLADASDSAIKDNKIVFLREPDIDYEKVELPADGPMKFDFEVEVHPEFELPSLEGIPVEKKKIEVTDEQITREIEQLRKWSGVWAPREEGKAEPDDEVIADVVLNVEGVEQPEKLDNTEIFVRHNGFVGAVPVENLDELLTGARSGNVKKTSVTVPKTYFREEYRGKKVDVEITVRDIKWLKPAELNEDFFKRFGVKDEPELRKGLRDRLQGRLEAEVRTEMAEQIYKHLLEKITFDLPLDIVGDQAATVLRRQYANLLARGLAREQIEEQMSQLQSASEQQAKNQLKTFFIMDKVAEKLGIQTTDEEINGYIARLAIQRKQRPERLKEEMSRDGSLAQFKLEVRDEKCIDKILESAKVTEVAAVKKPARAEKAVKAEKPAKQEKPAKAEREAKAEKPAKQEKPAKKEAKKTAEPEEKEAKKHKTPTRKKKT
jgi:trigger factor